MGAERLTIYGAGKVYRHEFKTGLHHELKGRDLYPTLFSLLRISTVRFGNTGEVGTFMFTKKICPQFLTASLLSIKEGAQALKADGKKIAWFDPDRLRILSNRVHRANEGARREIFRDILSRLYNKDLSPLDRLRVLKTEELIGIEELPKAEPRPEQQDFFPQDDPKVKKEAPEKGAPPKDPVRLEDLLRQGSLFGIEGFGKPINRGPKKG